MYVSTVACLTANMKFINSHKDKIDVYIKFSKKKDKKRILGADVYLVAKFDHHNAKSIGCRRRLMGTCVACCAYVTRYSYV